MARSRHHHPRVGAALARRQSDERAQGGLRRLRAAAPAGLSVVRTRNRVTISLGSLLTGSVPGIVVSSWMPIHVPDRALWLALAAVLFIVGGRLVPSRGIPRGVGWLGSPRQLTAAPRHGQPRASRSAIWSRGTRRSSRPDSTTSGELSG